ncbi:MAG: cold shock domain-containing protein [Phycisphaerales bacterium]|nr:cold shock domain-containing protein [Phycisphaerales bacterium]
MATGVIKWFDTQRGYGFIRKDDGGPDVLIQRNAVVIGDADQLSEGQSVEFEIAHGRDGMQAISVRMVS